MPSQRAAYFLLLLPPLFWAGNFVMGRFSAGQIPPMSLSYWRWMLAFIIAAPFVLPAMWRQRDIIKANLLKVTLLGCLGVAGFNSCVYLGLQNTTATNALIINSMIPIFILLCSRIFFATRIGPRQLVGILLSFAGVAVLLVRGDLTQLLSFEFNSGDSWIVLSSLVWALYSVGLRYKPAELEGRAFLGSTLLVGAIVLSPFFWLALPEAAFELNRNTLSALGYVAVFPSILAYFAWNHGVAKVGANVAGQYIHFMPLFGAGMSVLFLGESLALYHGAGALLIAAGLLAALLPRQLLIQRFKAN